MSGPRTHRLELEELAGEYAVCRLPPATDIPPWALAASGGHFTSITRTAEELSVVCDAAAVPGAVRSQEGWLCFRVAGTLDFSEIGILAQLARPLAETGVSIFVVSTFDTDYLMVPGDSRSRAVAAWEAAGHAVTAREETP